MNWIKLLPTGELPPNARKVVKVEQHAILLLHHDNQIYAVENSCPHLRLPMKNGKITEDGAIVCPFHRSAFDLCTGDVKEWSTFPPVIGKLVGRISTQTALPVYPTRVDEGSIWVGLS